jgi:hypothetical protein
MELVEKMKTRLQALDPHVLVTATDFSDLGPQALIETALFKLEFAGNIDRVCNRLYAINPPYGRIVKQVEGVLRLRVNGDFASSGHIAAFNLGLISLPPRNLEFWTNSNSVNCRFLGRRLIVKRVAPRKMALANEEVGQIVRALWFIGKEGLKDHLVPEKIFTRYTMSELDRLFEHAPYCLPDWAQGIKHTILSNRPCADGIAGSLPPKSDR